MTDPVKEQLSACLDGELPEGELDMLLKQVARDRPLKSTQSLQSTMGRYSLIGETLRSQRAVAASGDFAAKISAAIAAEPTLAQERTAARTAAAPVRWLKPLAGFAVAAGVAAVAIFTLQQPEQAPANYVADTALSMPETSTEAASYIVPASTDASGYVPAARLTNYVVAHSEYSSPLGRRSVLSGVLAGEDADVEDADADAQAIQPQATETSTTVVTRP